ncbi:MAG: hypothetical protein Kow002_05180 [Anaerolineales bacterium]
MYQNHKGIVSKCQLVSIRALPYSTNELLLKNSQMKTLLKTLSCFLLFVLLSSLTVQLAFDGPYPRPLGPQFDIKIAQNYRNDIETQKPDLLLLGDSMLGKGVDAETMEGHLGDSVYKIDIPGGSSAIWYLIMKSNIYPAKHRPQRLVIFFRGTMLTTPDFRVHGSSNLGLLNKYATMEDTLFRRRAYTDHMNPIDKAFSLYLPVYGYREEIITALEAGFRHTLPGLFNGCSPECADDAMEAVLRGDIAPEQLAEYIIRLDMALYAGRRLDFAHQVERSFLPEIIRMAQEKGMQVVMVRMPTQIFPNPELEPDGLDAYNADLEAYLSEQGIPLLNFEHDPRFAPEDFTEPTHLNQEAKQRFTEILAEALLGLQP